MKASRRVKCELGKIVFRTREGTEAAKSGQLGGDELLNRLNAMTLDQLSTYVTVQRSSLRSAQDDLQSQRVKGPHKVLSKVQKFVLEFDRFLNAYSGIMSIVTLVDAQYGSVASATLSLLFAVGEMQDN
jgi:hypothetical protein